MAGGYQMNRAFRISRKHRRNIYLDAVTLPCDGHRLFSGRFRDMVEFYRDEGEELYDAMRGPRLNTATRHDREWEEDPRLVGVEIIQDALALQEQRARLLEHCRKLWDPQHVPFLEKLEKLAEEMTPAELSQLFGVSINSVHAALARARRYRLDSVK